MNTSKQFKRIQRFLQGLLPSLGLFVILAVYLITAISMGEFLRLRMETTTLLGVVIAYGTGFGSQVTRMYIVFNGQMTEKYLRFGFDPSIVFALLLAIYTGYESYHLVPEYFVSIVGLIGSGFIVEYLYLRSLNRASRMELIGNKDSMNEIRNFFLAERNMEEFLDSLEDSRYNDYTGNKKLTLEQAKEILAKNAKENGTIPLEL
jgi:hypothetical protein